MALSTLREILYLLATQTRGFRQVLDCAACVGQVTNIGTGFEISIADTVDLISEAMGVSVEDLIDEMRERPAESEVDRLVACTKPPSYLDGLPNMLEKILVMLWR